MGTIRLFIGNFWREWASEAGGSGRCLDLAAWMSIRKYARVESLAFRSNREKGGSHAFHFGSLRRRYSPVNGVAYDVSDRVILRRHAKITSWPLCPRSINPKIDRHITKLVNSYSHSRWRVSTSIQARDVTTWIVNVNNSTP